MAAAAMATAALRRRWRLSLGGARRAYNARPLPPGIKLKLQPGHVRRPDPANPKTPSWQLDAAYEAKLYGRHGAASGVDPAALWPCARQLAAMEAEERDLFPPLRDMEAALDARERQEEARRREREELIASRMAKMPQMIANWLQEKEVRRTKVQEEKERRQQLLAETRERLGYNVDHRSPEFQEAMQEMEKARRKEMKLQKKQLREQVVAQKAEKAAAAATAASQPAKEGEAEAAAPPCQVT